MRRTRTTEEPGTRTRRLIEVIIFSGNHVNVFADTPELLAIFHPTFTRSLGTQIQIGTTTMRMVTTSRHTSKASSNDTGRRNICS